MISTLHTFWLKFKWYIIIGFILLIGVLFFIFNVDDSEMYKDLTKYLVKENRDIQDKILSTKKKDIEKKKKKVEEVEKKVEKLDSQYQKIDKEVEVKNLREVADEFRKMGY